ncbi:TPA: hypothetical protein L6B19_01405 [Pseudomonas aeruginosa]|nr:hypothetical protein CDC19_31585 [Pseudomonas aeruginosa]HBP5701181.1 hypothetical protein [Pseudomonas aeruginosa]
MKSIGLRFLPPALSPICNYSLMRISSMYITWSHQTPISILMPATTYGVIGMNWLRSGQACI